MPTWTRRQQPTTGEPKPAPARRSLVAGCTCPAAVHAIRCCCSLPWPPRHKRRAHLLGGVHANQGGRDDLVHILHRGQHTLAHVRAAGGERSQKCMKFEPRGARPGGLPARATCHACMHRPIAIVQLAACKVEPHGSTALLERMGGANSDSLAAVAQLAGLVGAGGGARGHISQEGAPARWERGRLQGREQSDSMPQAGSRHGRPVAALRTHLYVGAHSGCRRLGMRVDDRVRQLPGWAASRSSSLVGLHLGLHGGVAAGVEHLDMARCNGQLP